ncbi:MAG: MFS transporter [Bryobacteraceae bacterium]|jgi:acyl-[acyl-carrier-protein]-phospholipid O-acyltransferase/long-chain-fatty-acid--[acyl-carrier-protein] ligase
MSNRTQSAESSGSYARLLGDGGFQAFLWTQFLGAFNDNVYKMIVSIMALRLAMDQQAGSRYLALAGAVFVIPFLLFAGPAGQIADRFSKTRVLQSTKALEIVIMITGIGALLSHRIDMLLLVLFLLAVQANFFSPAKYGILPEMMPESQLARANGLLELTTFVAIVVGTSFGTLLFEHWQSAPLKIGLTLLGIALVGSATSLFITHTPPSGSRLPFRWNPFHEVVIGIRSLRGRSTLWLTVLGISWFWFVGALFQLSLLLVGEETLHASETRVGLLITALALGIGVGSVVAGRLAGDHIELGLVPLGSVLMGGFTIALGCTHSYEWAVAWLAAVGFSGGLFVVPLNAYLQDRAGAKEKGRVLATNNFLNMVGVVLASGVLWSLHDKLHWNAAHVIVALGIATLAATLYVVFELADVTLRFVVLGILRAFFRLRILNGERIPAEGGALLVANHVSYMDVPLLGYTTNRFIRFMMWKRLYDMKPLRPFYRSLHTIPLPTSSPKSTLRALRAAREEVSNGEMVCIFPEGAITQTGHVMPFQRGFERIVQGTGAPIIPIFFDGLWGHPLSYRCGGLFHGWRPIRRLLRWDVTIQIGEPMYGPISPTKLRQRILEMENQAMPRHKRPDSTLPHRLIAAVRGNWSALALADSTGKSLTFGKTLTAALLVRDWFDTRRPGEQRIGVLLPSSVGGALVNLGLALAGRTAVNLNFTTGEEGIRVAAQRCGLRTIITSRVFLGKIKLAATPEMVCAEDMLEFSTAAKVRALLSARFAPAGRLAGKARPDDVAAIIFTSGCTGEPKGVMLTHWNLIANMDTTAQVYNLTRRDCMLGVLPFFHSFGYTYTLWFPLIQRYPAVYHPNPMDAKTIGELAAKYHATFLLSTPTFCVTYLRQCTREQFASLRYPVVGAEKLRPALAQAFYEKFGVRTLEGYGCTEMGPVVAVNTVDVPTSDPPQIGSRAGTVGRAIPGLLVRVVNPETFEPVPEGEEGLLLLNGPARMAGYLDDPRRTAEALHDGYYITGDIGRVDEDGFIYILDRIARMSKIGGEMVPHLKVEEALSGVLGESPCCVVGIPDPLRGERLVAMYTSAEVTPAQVYEHLAGNGFPPLWTPKRENYYRVDAIPTLGTGKLDLRKARELAEQKAAEKAHALA